MAEALKENERAVADNDTQMAENNRETEHMMVL